MIRTIIWFIYFFVHLLAISPGLLKAKRLKKQGKDEELDEFVHITARNWARRLVKLAGGNIIVEGKGNIPENEPVLIVSNHQGNFDIPILLGWLDMKIGFISKIEVKKIPLISTWMEYLGCIFIDRENPRNAVKMIITGAESIKNGQNLVIFPEGTRSKGGPVAEFKKGSFKLAQKSNAAILPVTIDGSYNMMEANGKIITPATVKVTIHEPVRIHQNNPTIDGQELADITRGVIVKNQDVQSKKQ
ncbi:1-acyl-sn-glycerol-3-phosphate acyltransferase [Salipaludibacillus neizhouensis]|uniref:1-acyl-sn-glycerol-3-phosphate acyltransferase n=2 Tax=Salipaludibacillus neizhouensis TaxID=885475 RepID=A0A3A9K0K2_9BACI|nr:1-acyl-sn-glycerol-3-phosphate acyltransferase [Salipaludibacillus neizhouensis]